MAKRVWKDEIGQNFVDRLDDIVIEIGGDAFSRRELVKIANVANFIAAQTLGEVLKRKWKPKNVASLAKDIDIHMLLAQDRIGDTAVMVWCSILEASGIDVNAWLDQDFTETNRAKDRRTKAWREAQESTRKRMRAA